MGGAKQETMIKGSPSTMMMTMMIMIIMMMVLLLMMMIKIEKWFNSTIRKCVIRIVVLHYALVVQIFLASNYSLHSLPVSALQQKQRLKDWHGPSFLTVEMFDTFS